MAVERIADMSRDELEALIEQAVRRQIQTIFKPRDSRTMKEINESIRRNRWAPPLGSPSTLELLREDRDA